MTPTIEAQLMGILTEFNDELGEEVHDAFKDTGKDTAKLLKQTSPTGHSSKHYKDGWTSKTTGKGIDTTMVVYNKLKPGLTHLLENGHQIYVNRMNKGRANGIKHIEPAEQKAIEELMRKLR